MLTGALRSIVVIFLWIMFLNFIPFGLFNDSIKSSVVAEPLLNIIELYKQPENIQYRQDPFEDFE